MSTFDDAAPRQITCPDCGRTIAAEAVNVQKMVAQCVDCNSVFDFSAQLPARQRDDDAVAPRRRAVVAMPDSIKVDHIPAGAPAPEGSPYRENQRPHLDTLLIRRRWFTGTHVALFFFGIIWCLFLFVWYGMASAHGHAPWFVYVFPLGHVAVGVWLIYYSLAGFFNTTEIAVTAEELSIKHRPLPWRGNRRLTVASIEQIYCTEKKATRKDGSPANTYRVHALLIGRRRAKLLSGLPEAEQALYIEAQIEEHLEIEDARVAGDYKG